MSEPTPVIAVVGATATGKSDLAVDLARRLGGEVVNADSMQLYRGMDIGTAKPDEAVRRVVPHHLLDVWDVQEPASVAEYQRLARATFAELAGRGTVAVLVGGSGLYVRAAIDQLEFPGTDPDVRQRLEAELAERGAGALHQRLADLDPAAALSIDPNNGRRVVRALEVIELTGRPFTASLPAYRYAVPAVQVGLDVPRDELDQRIEARVRGMAERGLVDEVRRLEAAGLRDGPTASRALGYAQVLRHLAGECSEAAALAETARATRRFARRQDTWFRRDPRVHWLRPGEAVDAAALVAAAGRVVGVFPDSR
ncbi:MAG: tRNA dimethylallyltransferase [Actinomycetota bacterium]|nr:tRNA dimethylallyltransferase [Actinomycetota bacterium]